MIHMRPLINKMCTHVKLAKAKEIQCFQLKFMASIRSYMYGKKLYLAFQDANMNQNFT